MSWPREQDEARSGSGALNWTGGSLIAVGLALVSPGFKDIVISGINKFLGLGLPLDAPWWIGLIFVFLGALFLLPLLLRQFHNSRKSDDPPRGFLALRHVSLDLSLPGKLTEQSLPKWLGRRYLRHADCDQTRSVSSGADKVFEALEIQEQAFNEITVQRRNDDQLAIGYYGVAHVPLQILAGHTATTAYHAALFELDRANSTWRELERGSGADLGIQVVRRASPTPPASAVLRVAVSYDISMVDISEVVASPFDELLVSIATPKRDVITHYGQVEAIASTFRDALDSVRDRLPKGGVIHIFAAVPMSLGFSLGRMITKTVHPEVIAYNFTAQARPSYSWGIRINVNDLGRRQVVKPKIINFSKSTRETEA